MDALIVDVGRPTQAKQSRPTVCLRGCALRAWKIKRGATYLVASNGMTISPAQRAWLDTLARDGWSFVSVLIEAQRASITSPDVWGPVVTLAFESD